MTEPRTLKLQYETDDLILLFPHSPTNAREVECPSGEVAKRIAYCLNACRGLNPEHVPELVKFAKAVSLLIDAPLWAEAAKELLAKVKA